MIFNKRIQNGIISICLLLLACGITGFVYWDTQRALMEIEVPILKAELPIGTKITQSHLGHVWIHQKSAQQMGVVIDSETIENQYLKNKIGKGRPLYESDFSKEKPKIEVNEKIESGAITIRTDLIKSVGGVIKSDSHVRIWILIKDSQGQRVESPIQLQNVKVLAVQSKNREGELSSITFEATPQQQQILVNAEYGGEIHLALLPQKEAK